MLIRKTPQTCLSCNLSAKHAGPVISLHLSMQGKRHITYTVPLSKCEKCAKRETHLDTRRASVGLRRAPERGVKARAATNAVCLGGPSPDIGLAAMPTLFSGIGGVPTSGATGSVP